MTVPAPAVAPAPPAEPVARGGGWLANPILVRELRATFRGRRFLAIHLGALALSAAVALPVAAACAAAGPHAGSYAGSALFCLSVLTQAALTFLVFPAYACTSIAAERERGTLDLLYATSLRPREVVWGNFCAAMAYAGVFLTSALPLTALGFLFGGVTIAELLLAYAALLALAALVAIWSVLVSAMTATSARAITVGYALTLSVGAASTLAAGGAVVQLLGEGRLPNEELARAFAALSAAERDVLVAGAGLGAAAAYAFLFLCATMAITPPATNRATAPRAFALGLGTILLLGCIFGMRRLWPALGPLERWEIAAGGWSTIALAAVLGTVVALDPPELSPRLRQELDALQGWRRPLRLFWPGPGRGWAFSLLLAALLLGGLRWGSVCADPTAPAGPGGTSAPALDLAGAAGESLAVAAAYAVFAGGVALHLARSRWGAAGRAAALAGVLVSCALAPLLVWGLEDLSAPRPDTDPDAAPSASFGNLYPFSPLTVFGAIWVTPYERFQHAREPKPPPPPFPVHMQSDWPGTPAWRVCALAYGALGGALTLAAAARAAFAHRRRTPLPGRIP